MNAATQTEATKGWKKLVAKLSKQRGVKDPSALAAWIMRTKKGGESVTNVPANLIEQAANGVDIRKLISELHDPYDEGEFQEGLRKVGEMLVKACRSLDDLRTMIGLPSESAKQLDDATSQCSEAVKSVKVMLHDSMNPPQADPDPATADAPKPDLEDDTDDDDPDRADVYKPDSDESGDPMLGEPQRSQQEKRKRKESKRGRKHEHVERSIIEQVAAGADPYLTVKHLNESQQPYFVTNGTKVYLDSVAWKEGDFDVAKDSLTDQCEGCGSDIGETGERKGSSVRCMNCQTKYEVRGL